MLCKSINNSSMKEEALESLKQVNQKQQVVTLEQMKQDHLLKDNATTKISTLQALCCNNPQKDTSGKRKERTHRPTYNSNKDNKAGRLSNNYYEIELNDVK